MTLAPLNWSTLALLVGSDERTLSIISISPLSPSHMVQGDWSEKATKLSMVSGLENLIPSENHPWSSPSHFPKVTSVTITKSLGPQIIMFCKPTMAEVGSLHIGHQVNSVAQCAFHTAAPILSALVRSIDIMGECRRQGTKVLFLAKIGISPYIQWRPPQLVSHCNGALQTQCNARRYYSNIGSPKPP